MAPPGAFQRDPYTTLVLFVTEGRTTCCRDRFVLFARAPRKDERGRPPCRTRLRADSGHRNPARRGAGADRPPHRNTCPVHLVLSRLWARAPAWTIFNSPSRYAPDRTWERAPPMTGHRRARGTGMPGVAQPSDIGEPLGPLAQGFAAIVRPELPSPIKEIGLQVTRAYPEHALLLRGPSDHPPAPLRPGPPRPARTHPDRRDQHHPPGAPDRDAADLDRHTRNRGPDGRTARRTPADGPLPDA